MTDSHRSTPPSSSRPESPENVTELWICRTSLWEIDRTGERKQILDPDCRAYFVRRLEVDKYAPRLTLVASNNEDVSPTAVMKDNLNAFNFEEVDAFGTSFTTYYFSKAKPLKELTVQAVEGVRLPRN